MHPGTRPTLGRIVVAQPSQPVLLGKFLVGPAVIRIANFLGFGLRKQYTLPCCLITFRYTGYSYFDRFKNSNTNTSATDDQARRTERLHGLHYRWQHCRIGLHVGLRHGIHHRNRWRPHWYRRGGTGSEYVLRATTGTTAAAATTGTAATWVHVRVCGRTLNRRDHEVQTFFLRIFFCDNWLFSCFYLQTNPVHWLVYIEQKTMQLPNGIFGNGMYC